MYQKFRNLKPLQWILIFLVVILYFDFTQSFIYLKLFNGLWIKKWYLAIIVIGINIFIKKKYWNEENLVSILMISLSYIWFWLDSDKSLVNLIKLTLLYYIPILIFYIIKDLEIIDINILLKLILIVSCIYIVLSFLYISIDKIPSPIMADNREFHFNNTAPWKNPFTVVEISRYTFPGMEHGMFFARLYILIFISIILMSINKNIGSYIIFSIGYLAAVLTASRSSFIGFCIALLAYQILIYIKEKIILKYFILYFIALNILFTVILKEYILRQFIFLGGFKFFSENLKLDKNKITGLENEYHIRNSSFSIPESNQSNIDLENRPLGLFYNFINDLGLVPTILIFSALVFLIIKKYQNMKYSNFEYFQIAILIAIITKCAINQGENEYYIWIIIGISLINKKNA